MLTCACGGTSRRMEPPSFAHPARSIRRRSASSSAISLRSRYAKPSTDKACARRRFGGAGHVIAGELRYLLTRLLCGPQYWHAVWSQIACGCAMGSPLLTYCMVLQRKLIAYNLDEPVPLPVISGKLAICLRVRYAKSGTDMASGGTRRKLY